ncbi:outer membrane protein [Legionella sp. W05-934-2]|uniref:outer membrane protein n=1 Tax=Legionella sp. W05-934-2 TaxID=1198649 RepID=UPI00346227EC
MIMRHFRSTYSIFKFVILILNTSLVGLNVCVAANYQASAYIGGTTTTFSRYGQLYFNGETDRLVLTNNHFSDITWGAAAAVRLNAPGKLQTIIKELSIGPEFFYFSTTGVGDVWQYQLPEMNNLTYRIPVTSFRLLATNEVTFNSFIDNVYLFFVWGMGFAANESSFQEYPRPSYNWSGLLLDNSTQYNFAYTLGGGIKLDISDLAKLKNKRLQLSLRYLYANLGSADVTNIANTPFIKPISVHLFTQSWVAGLTCLF